MLLKSVLVNYQYVFGFYLFEFLCYVRYYLDYVCYIYKFEYKLKGVIGVEDGYNFEYLDLMKILVDWNL